jgi:hypothetical protein
MEPPEGSLPCWKEHATGPYPEPDVSSPYVPKIHSNIILSSAHFWNILHLFVYRQNRLRYHREGA